MLADTAIVRNGTFSHYCHKCRSFVTLRIHHKFCLLCQLRNPGYIPNKLAYSVVNMNTERVIFVFEDMQQACIYISEHPTENLAVGDVGYVKSVD